MDYLIRWSEARATHAATALEASKFIYEDIICRHDIVDIIYTDQGNSLYQQNDRSSRKEISFQIP